MDQRMTMIDAQRRAEKLTAKLRHAIDMERRAQSRVRRSATLLKKWSNTRRRIERTIGESEVQRMLDSEQAIAEITKRKNTVRKTVNRLNPQTEIKS